MTMNKRHMHEVFAWGVTALAVWVWTGAASAQVRTGGTGGASSTGGASISGGSFGGGSFGGSSFSGGSFSGNMSGNLSRTTGGGGAGLSGNLYQGVSNTNPF